MISRTHYEAQLSALARFYIRRCLAVPETEAESLRDRSAGFALASRLPRSELERALWLVRGRGARRFLEGPRALVL